MGKHIPLIFLLVNGILFLFWGLTRFLLIRNDLAIGLITCRNGERQLKGETLRHRSARRVFGISEPFFSIDVLVPGPSRTADCRRGR